MWKIRSITPLHHSLRLLTRIVISLIAQEDTSTGGCRRQEDLKTVRSPLWHFWHVAAVPVLGTARGRTHSRKL